MLFALAGAAIGAGLSYLSAQEDQENVERQRRMLEESKITESERFRKVKNIEKQFNTEIAGSQNQMALNTRGADASLTMSAAFGAGVGQKISAMGSMESAIDEGNRQITQQIAGINDVNTTGAVVGGAIQGGIAGAQIGSLVGDAASTTEDITQTIAAETSTRLEGVTSAAESIGNIDPNDVQGITQLRQPQNSLSDVMIHDYPTKTKSGDIAIKGPGNNIMPSRGAFGLEDSGPAPIQAPSPIQAMNRPDQQELPNFYGTPSFGGASVIGQGEPIFGSFRETMEGVNKAKQGITEFGQDVVGGVGGAIGDASSWVWNTLARRPR